jgi:hypothetical protein
VPRRADPAHRKRRHRLRDQRKASKKTAKAKKAANPKKAAKPTKPKSTRPGSKTEKVLELMKRKEGATLAEIAKATEWQNHSIRGFVSGPRHEEARHGCRVDEERTSNEPPRKGAAFVVLATFWPTLRRER